MANITQIENAEWIYFVTLEKAVLVWEKTTKQNKCHHWQKNISINKELKHYYPLIYMLVEQSNDQ